MKTASFNAFTSSPMAMQHPLAKNQKALGQSQREGLSILIPVPEFDKLSSLNCLALKPQSLGNTVRVPLEEGNTFTDALENASRSCKRRLRSSSESEWSLQNLSKVLEQHGLDIGIVRNPEEGERPGLKAVIVAPRLKEEKYRLVIPFLGIGNPSQLGTPFSRPEEKKDSIMAEVKRVFSEQDLKIILKEYNRRMGLLKADISVLSRDKS
ncbi:MAG: hypothetical protein ACK551_03020 [Vampirovibrionales bacterium]